MIGIVGEEGGVRILDVDEGLGMYREEKGWWWRVYGNVIFDLKWFLDDMKVVSCFFFKVLSRFNWKCYYSLLYWVIRYYVYMFWLFLFLFFLLYFVVIYYLLRLLFFLIFFVLLIIYYSYWLLFWVEGMGIFWFMMFE